MLCCHRSRGTAVIYRIRPKSTSEASTIPLLKASCIWPDGLAHDAKGYPWRPESQITTNRENYSQPKVLESYRRVGYLHGIQFPAHIKPPRPARSCADSSMVPGTFLGIADTASSLCHELLISRFGRWEREKLLVQPAVPSRFNHRRLGDVFPYWHGS